MMLMIARCHHPAPHPHPPDPTHPSSTLPFHTMPGENRLVARLPGTRL